LPYIRQGAAQVCSVSKGQFCKIVVILHGRAFLPNHKHGKGYKSNLVSEESQNILDWPSIKTQGMESIMQKETDNETNHDGSESSGRNKVDNENTSGGKNVGRGLGRGGGKGRRDGTGGGRGRGGGGKGGRRK
jgi:hypothetical protein